MGVFLEPEIQFGAPCIKGTRIPTRTIVGMIEAGTLPLGSASLRNIPGGSAGRAVTGNLGYDPDNPLFLLDESLPPATAARCVLSATTS